MCYCVHNVMLEVVILMSISTYKSTSFLFCVLHSCSTSSSSNISIRVQSQCEGGREAMFGLFSNLQYMYMYVYKTQKNNGIVEDTIQNKQGSKTKRKRKQSTHCTLVSSYKLTAQQLTTPLPHSNYHLAIITADSMQHLCNVYRAKHVSDLRSGSCQNIHCSVATMATSDMSKPYNR